MPFFTNNKKENDVLMESMLRLAVEGGGNWHKEVLSLLAEAHGEGSVLTIIRRTDRSIIASSEEGFDPSSGSNALGAFVGSVTYVDRTCYYARRERTNVTFREGIECVRVRPMDGCDFSAILEIPSMEQLADRKYFDLLTILTNEWLAEKSTGGQVPGRIECLKALRDAAGCSVAAYGMNDEDLLSADERGLKEYSQRLGKALAKAGAFKLDEGSFAVIVGGEDVDAAEEATAWLDKCFEEGLVQTSCGCAGLFGGARQAIYLAQKGQSEAARGELRFVGDEDAPMAVRGRTVELSGEVRIPISDGETEGGLVYEGPKEETETHEGSED